MNPSLSVIRVLLIEDEAGDAYFAKNALTKKHIINFEIIWVQSLALAKDALIETCFDIVLLDLSLPDSQGLETVKMARQILGDIPIIVLTGCCDTEFALTTLKAGANDYMVKGDFGFDGLTRVIRHVLLRSEMEVHNLLLVAALNAAANAIVITDRDAHVKWSNPAFSQLTGYSLEEAMGKNISELVKSGLQEHSFYENMWQHLLAGKQWRGEVINKRKDGSLYHEELNIAPVKNHSGEIISFIGIKEDISERKYLEEILLTLANTDPLTGLFNRRVFLERLEQEAERVSRLGESVALLMLDLDFFKRINDTYGHAMGDEVLKQFSQIMKAHSRNIDVPARLGGEEFAILLLSTNKEAALMVAERLREQVAEIVIPHDKGDVRMTVSIGGALLSSGDNTGEIVLNQADSAMYKAKESGRNRTCWFDSSDE